MPANENYDVVVLLDPDQPQVVPLSLLSAPIASIDATLGVPARIRRELCATVASEGTRILIAMNPDEAEVRAARAGGARVESVASQRHERHVSTDGDAAPAALARAIEVMAHAVDIGEWEKKQTHQSLVPYLREETHELIEAIVNGSDDHHLKSELGDVLMQVLFHAEVARRRGAFDIGDVAQSFIEKLRRRAPFLFDGTTDEVPEHVQIQLWNRAKREQESEERKT